MRSDNNGDEKILENSTFRQFITIIMPALNEEMYVEKAIRSLMENVCELDFEILIIDGGSIDGTIDIVKKISSNDNRVSLIHNNRRIQSAGINIGVALSDKRSEIIIRADCHAHYPKEYLTACMQPFADPKIAAVVVPMHTRGISCFQKAAATAQNSWLGNGGSAHRRVGQSRFVEHGHHAAIRKDVFLRLKGYDEDFTHNEDAELDARIKSIGGLIWLAAESPIVYYPRNNPISLAKQYFRHGQGRAMTTIKHRHFPKIRQMFPLVVTAVSIISIIVSPLTTGLSLVFPGFYLIICLLIGGREGIKSRNLCASFAGFTAIIMHYAWAFGFTSRCILSAFKPRTPLKT